MSIMALGPTSSELYACRRNVTVPLLSVSSKDKPTTNTDYRSRSRSSLATRSSSISTARSTIAAIPSSSNQHVSEKRFPPHFPRYQKQHIISDLIASLKFEDRVVYSRCPELVSYKETKSRIGDLCRPPEVIFKGQDTGLRDTGRCDMRGEGRRHIPCYLHSQTNDTKDHVRLPVASKRRCCIKDIVPARVVPEVPSVEKWEESVLKGVSSRTAQGFLERSRSVDRRHYEEVLESAGRREREEISRQDEEEGENGEDESEDLAPPNEYLIELSRGAVPVYDSHKPPDAIWLDNSSKFNKVLQECYPKAPAIFLGNEDEPVTGHTIGYKKWQSLPVRAPSTSEVHWILNTDITSADDESSFKASKKYEVKRKPTKVDRLLRVAKELFDKWQVHVQPQDVSEEVAMKNLNSVSSNAQLFGLAIVGHIIDNKLHDQFKPEFSFILTSRKPLESSNNEKESYLPIRILDKLNNLLKYEAERVRVSSAILLCCLDKKSEEIISVLHSSSQSDHIAEQLAAVQSLAIEGICTAVVIKGLLFIISQSDSIYDQKFKRAAKLLGGLSRNSNLVYSMLLEQLNSKSSQERYITCQLLPLLHGGINRDVCNRLVTMSWDDWSPDVKMAAAQALGRTGHAKLIHDEIERRLRIKSEGTRLDALKKIHSLHLMTSKLLPAFVECFKDDHISIKLEAIAIAETLSLNDDDVIAVLTDLMSDNCWKVKAHAIRALGTLKADWPDILSHLLWAVRFERLPEVRAETCRALAELNVRNDKVAKALKDLLIVEENQLVVNQAVRSLIELGYDPTVKDEMADAVCSEVKKLGTQKAITGQIFSSQSNEMVKYMLIRPTNTLSTRDYFNEKLRYKHISSKTDATMTM